MNIRTVRYQSTRQWIRAITTSPRLTTQPVISFGAESDAVLSKYTKAVGRPPATQGQLVKQPAEDQQDEKPPRQAKETRQKLQPLKDSDSGLQIRQTSGRLVDDRQKAAFTEQTDTKRPQDITRESRLFRAGSGSKTPRTDAAKRDTRPRVRGPPIAEDFQIDDFVDLSSAERSRDEEVSNASSGTIDKKKIEPPQPKRPRPTLEQWAVQKNALREKFPEGWLPRKKLSPDVMEGIRGLHEQDSKRYTTEVLAEQFKTSPEAIRRILRSKWMMKAGPEIMEERRERWAQRHDRIWDSQAELGLRKRRTKSKEIEDPDKFDQDMARTDLLGAAR